MLFKLFVVVNHRINDVHHRLSHLKNLGRPIQPAISLEEIVGHLDPSAVVLHAKIIQERIILREVFRAGLQASQAKALLSLTWSSCQSPSFG